MMSWRSPSDVRPSPRSGRTEVKTSLASVVERGIDVPRIFTVEELETGLRMLGRADLDQNLFWDANIASFRKTVLFAIRETSDALLSAKIASAWRSELESQLETLVQYLDLSERYVRRRASGRSSVN
jgi:hypothetical protein